MKARKLFAVGLAAALALSAPVALADTISFEGRVAASYSVEVFADVGGTVDALSVSVGEAVTAGTPIATLKTGKVYAEQSGTVTGIFAQPGDSATSVAERYGAVLYIEPESAYTIAASTEKAYNSAETKYVHVGEHVYLSCYSDGDHTGEGRITAASGTDFTVEVTSGEFLVGETVSVYREEDYSSSSRIGRGELSRSNPVAVTGSGSIVALAVSDGDTVERGDLLFETLEGAFDGLYMSGCDVAAPVDGCIAALNTAVGANVAENASVATLYPTDAMRIEASVSESDLGSIAVGDQVTIELNWNQDDEVSYPGTVTMISAIADQSATEGEASYTVYIDFTPDADTRYGMQALITTVDTTESDDAIDDTVEPDAPDAEDALSAEANSDAPLE